MRVQIYETGKQCHIAQANVFDRRTFGIANAQDTVAINQNSDISDNCPLLNV